MLHSFSTARCIEDTYLYLLIANSHCVTPTETRLHAIYRTVPFSMTLNDRYPDFNGTSLFDVEYLRNDTI